jgi:hypothetical protein
MQQGNHPIPSKEEFCRAKKVRRRSFLDNLRRAKEIFFLQEKGYTLGMTAMDLPVTIISFLKSAPNIEKIHAFTRFPQIAEMIDSKVCPRSLEVLSEYPWKWGAFVYLRYKDDSISFCKIQGYPFPNYYPEETRNRLKMWGLQVPEIGESLLSRTTKDAAKEEIFINPFSRANASTIPKLMNSYVNSIKKLVERGEQVALHAGISPNQGYLNVIKERISQRIGNSPNFSVKKFEGVQELMKYLSGAKAVLTIDTSIYHIAQLYQIPTVVIKTEDSSGWVRKEQPNVESYRWVKDSDFERDPYPALWLLEYLIQKDVSARAALKDGSGSVKKSV